MLLCYCDFIAGSTLSAMTSYPASNVSSDPSSTSRSLPSSPKFLLLPPLHSRNDVKRERERERERENGSRRGVTRKAHCISHPKASKKKF